MSAGGRVAFHVRECQSVQNQRYSSARDCSGICSSGLAFTEGLCDYAGTLYVLLG